MENETKGILLQTTRTIIDESGLDSVTLREVGSRANLSRSAAYRHFRDKEDLLAAIALEDFEILLKRFEELPISASDPKGVARGMLLQFHSFGVANPVHYQLMFSTAWDRKKYPALHGKAEMVFERARSLIARLLEYYHVDPAQTPKRTAVVFAFIHGVVELHLAGHFERIKALDDTEMLVDEVLRLISTDEA
jgi:AcrR family transcriptional regulator